MESSKMDRRKKYTRMRLRDSLIELLKDKEITAITIKELCEQADINRSTFYAHYRDQLDLLETIEEEIIEDMAAYMAQYEERQEDDQQMIEKLMAYFASKKEVCRILLNDKKDTGFQKKVMTFAHQTFMKNWTPGSELDEDLYEYVSTFIISGSIHVIKRWLNNDMDKSPKEMAEIINRLVKEGLGES
ncbi:TetR/AcrR family transcriptional regulator [Planococcus lenghuensis]|uniref:TetR family transcriptional regulator n=1 Tax=Planococcus lenghuensis TaxID=2213202 RepID=A0A1Q2KVR7_9BACL|nr:TetR/AcrR family transcriptional regulator [Planococcus lenghuensis]AQQ52290.1 TetR family transcriptional regulator [Planococcus lenghuensis]